MCTTVPARSTPRLAAISPPREDLWVLTFHRTLVDAGDGRRGYWFRERVMAFAITEDGKPIPLLASDDGPFETPAGSFTLQTTDEFHDCVCDEPDLDHMHFCMNCSGVRTELVAA